jgi:hypothetical protein
MSAKKSKLVAVKLSKNQLAEVAKRETSRLCEALRSVAVAGSADGACMLALHSLRMHNIACAPALVMAIEALGEEGNKDVLKARKTKLKAICEAVDAGKSVMYKGVKTTVGSLLAKVNGEGKIKPGSLQGLYSLVNPPAAKSQQESRDWVNEQVLQLMQRDATKGGGLWVISAENANWLQAEYKKVQAEAKAKADAKEAKKAA